MREHAGRWRRVFLAAAGLLVGLVLLYVAANASSRRAVEQRIAALRAAGVPATGADLNRPAMPPAENAASLYLQASATALDLDQQWRKSGFATLWRDPRAPAGQVTAAEHLLAQYREVFELLEEAARRPACRWPTDYRQGYYATAPPYHHMGYIARVLGYRAVLLAHRGERGAYEGVATALRVANHLRAEPSRTGQFWRWTCLGTAVAGLASVVEVAPPTAGQVQALWPLLDPRDPQGSLRVALVGERAMVATLWQQTRADPSLLLVRLPELAARATVLGSDPPPPWYAAPVVGVGRPLLDCNFVRLLDWYGKVIDVQQRSGPAYYAAAGRLDRQWGAVPTHLRLLNHAVVPSVWDRIAADQAAACCVMARWALALARYRAVHGRYPATLAQARPLAPGEPGRDPFAGKPPAYKRTAEGYQMYCLGRNGRDEGGLRYSDPGAPADADDWSWQHVEEMWAR